MKIAVFSDIHANEPALMAVYQDASARGVDKFWCLGDMIGYYTDPVEPLMFVKRYVDDDDWVMGNHDAMLADLILPQDDPSIKSAEIESKGGRIRVRGQYQSIEDWQMTNATPIKALGLNRVELDAHAEASRFWRDSFTLDRMKPRRKNLNGRDHVRVHASLRNHTGRYVFGWQHEILIPKEFQALEEDCNGSSVPQTLWFGHTHVPTLVFGRKNGGEYDADAVFIEFGKPYRLENRWALINPGSVGQSRDGDRRAAYAILDTDAQAVTFIRVEYAYQDTARRLLMKGYPDALVTKLLTAPPVKEMPEVWKNHHARNGRNEE
jgi:predicted phosphodiesterase